MNKYQEALNVLKKIEEENNYKRIGLFHHTQCDILQELVDKATPKKVSKKGAYKTYDEDFEYEHYKCPNCNKEIVVSGNWVTHYDEVNYCKHCGQKLDWR